MKIKFYDTSSLLMLTKEQLEKEKFAISSITLQELENIKTSSNKDEKIKTAARYLLHNLEKVEYILVLYKENFHKYITKYKFELNNDTMILSCAIYLQKESEYNDITFITNDLCLKHIAASIFSGTVESIEYTPEEEYEGYKDFTLTDEEMANFYSNQNSNLFNLFVNEYLIIRNSNAEIVDTLKWTEKGYKRLTYGNFNSNYFGNIKPMKNDIYQSLVADSFLNNTITMVKGPAGSGKTYLSLGYLMSLLEKNKIDKIIIFCNTIATKGSAKLGYYPGTRDEKLLDSQIGNLLSSKFGGKIEVERMITEEKLVLLPLSDIRGYDTSGMKAGIYISEAQNLDINLMKLALQRIGSDSICIIDGDCKAQVDDISFAGKNNGMKRVSEVFRGQDFYGEINLKNIHRSKIAKIAEYM